jgi:hypothetical protein
MKLLEEEYTNCLIVFTTDTGYFPYTATITTTVSPTSKPYSITLPPDKGTNHRAGLICAVVFACLFSLVIIFLFIDSRRMKAKRARAG